MKARVLVADPPWSFGDKLPGNGRGAEKHYDVLDLSAIKTFPLPELEDDAVLFLWRVSSQVEEAYAVARAWGFTPKSELVWIKTTGEDTITDDGEIVEAKDAFGMGRIVRGAHETCIIAARGRAHIHVKDRSVRTIFRAPIGKHSEKPEAFYQIVEKLFPLPEKRELGDDPTAAMRGEGSHVELFARRERAGWMCFGNELDRDAPSKPPPFTAIEVDIKTPKLDEEIADVAAAEADSIERDFVSAVDFYFAQAKASALPICAVCLDRQFYATHGTMCVNRHEGARGLNPKTITRHDAMLAIASPRWGTWFGTPELTPAEITNLELPGAVVDEPELEPAGPDSFGGEDTPHSPSAARIMAELDERELGPVDRSMFRGVPREPDGSATINDIKYAKSYIDMELDELEGKPPPVPAPKSEKPAENKTAPSNPAPAPAEELPARGRGRKPDGWENFSRDVVRIATWTAQRVTPTISEFAAWTSARRKEVVAWLDARDAGDTVSPPPKFLSKMIAESIKEAAAAGQKGGASAPARAELPPGAANVVAAMKGEPVTVAGEDEAERASFLAHAVRTGLLTKAQAEDRDAWADLVVKAPVGWFKKARMEIAERIECVPCDAGEAYTVATAYRHSCTKKLVDAWTAARAVVISRWEEFVEEAAA